MYAGKTSCPAVVRAQRVLPHALRRCRRRAARSHRSRRVRSDRRPEIGVVANTTKVRHAIDIVVRRRQIGDGARSGLRKRARARGGLGHRTTSAARTTTHAKRRNHLILEVHHTASGVESYRFKSSTKSTLEDAPTSLRRSVRPTRHRARDRRPGSERAPRALEARCRRAASPFAARTTVSRARSFVKSRLGLADEFLQTGAGRGSGDDANAHRAAGLAVGTRRELRHDRSHDLDVLVERLDGLVDLVKRANVLFDESRKDHVVRRVDDAFTRPEVVIDDP